MPTLSHAALSAHPPPCSGSLGWGEAESPAVGAGKQPRDHNERPPSGSVLAHPSSRPLAVRRRAEMALAGLV